MRIMMMMIMMKSTLNDSKESSLRVLSKISGAMYLRVPTLGQKMILIFRFMFCDLILSCVFFISLILYQPCVWRNVQGVIFVPVAHCKSKICYHCCTVVPETHLDEDGDFCDDDVNDDIDVSDRDDTYNKKIRMFHKRSKIASCIKIT